MRTRKCIFLVFISVFLITGKILNANTDVNGSPSDCSEMLSSNPTYTPYEKDIADLIFGLTRRAIRDGLLSLEDFGKALAHENYDITKVAAKGYDNDLPLFHPTPSTELGSQSKDVLRYVEKVFALTNLPDASRTNIGKLVLLKLLDHQSQSSRHGVESLWTQISAARVLNALIRDRVILSRGFTDLVLQETARELNVDQVYPGDSHLHLNQSIADWIRGGSWDKKTDELKRIAFFVTLSLQQQTQNFANYYHLINIDKADRPVFDTFMRELVQSMVADTLELSLVIRRDRLFSARDSVRVAGVNVVTTGLMVGGTQVVVMGDVPSITAMAAGGAICGAYLMWRDIYAHFKGWLGQRRLALRWKQSAQQLCQISSLRTN